MFKLFVTPWTVASQAPLFMEFPRQEYWSQLPFPSPGDLPDPGIKPRSPALQADTLPTKLLVKPLILIYKVLSPNGAYPKEYRGWGKNKNANKSVTLKFCSLRSMEVEEESGKCLEATRKRESASWGSWQWQQQQTKVEWLLRARQGGVLQQFYPEAFMLLFYRWEKWVQRGGIICSVSHSNKLWSQIWTQDGSTSLAMFLKTFFYMII